MHNAFSPTLDQALLGYEQAEEMQASFYSSRDFANEVVGELWVPASMLGPGSTIEVECYYSANSGTPTHTVRWGGTDGASGHVMLNMNLLPNATGYFRAVWRIHAPASQSNWLLGGISLQDYSSTTIADVIGQTISNTNALMQPLNRIAYCKTSAGGTIYELNIRVRSNTKGMPTFATSTSA